MEERNIEPEWLPYAAGERYSGLSHATLWRYVSSGDLILASALFLRLPDGTEKSAIELTEEEFISLEPPMKQWLALRR